MEKISKNFISQYLPDAPIILEAGAHIGRDTIKMSKLWPKATIYAFEPVRELYEKLLINTANLKNIYCYNYALSNVNGSIDMFVGQGTASALSSMYEPTKDLTFHSKLEFSKQKVQSITLKKWAEEFNLKKIDFMWLDMQGSEIDMLKAAIEITKKTKLILIEANLIERYKKIPLYPEIIDWFKNQNFLAIAQSDPKNQKIDILFINESL